jgi:cyclohexanone monooxygenase
MYMSNEAVAQEDQLDAIVIGAGFAGLYMLYKLRGLGLNARILEAGEGVGGTWYWNRYPGARCDVPSLQYSYQFSKELEQEWDWKKRYAPQAEIMAYANHVADRFELQPHIQFGTRVAAAHFDDAKGRWHVTTEDGQQASADYCAMATGCLSAAIEQHADFVADSIEYLRDHDLRGFPDYIEKCESVAANDYAGFQLS